MEKDSNIVVLEGIYLQGRPSRSLWDIALDAGKVRRITRHSCPSDVPCNHQLLLPELCHPHIHLDKPFLLSSNLERYHDLTPKEGSFSEALKKTAAAKSRFTADDLYKRGSWLIDESIAAGVTAMRAFVEIDTTVGMLCIETGLRLKQDYRNDCFIQICAFAQDPIFTGKHKEENRELLENALMLDGVEVVGTTPYVEGRLECCVQNIDWAIEAALRLNLHLDFHLDYSLDIRRKPMILETVKRLLAKDWASRTSKTISIGHCSKLTQLSGNQVERLARDIQSAKLPLSFVGLPTSDLYMMGRSAYGGDNTSEIVRGTMNIPQLIQEHGLNGAIGVNNVGNAFTPYGSPDPLWLASFGVGLYHRGTATDARLLYECISTRAREAIGLPLQLSEIQEGERVHGLLFECQPLVRYRAEFGRQQSTIEEIVWCPPSIERRKLLRSSNIGSRITPGCRTSAHDI